MESDHEFTSIGLFSSKHTFYTTKKIETKVAINDNDTVLARVDFLMSLDAVSHKRKIYSPLDYLGDVGGLSDALWVIG